MWCTVQVNISEVVNTVFSNVLTMQQDGVKLLNEVDPGMSIIIADKDRLTQVKHTDAWVVMRPLQLVCLLAAVCLAPASHSLGVWYLRARPCQSLFHALQHSRHHNINGCRFCTISWGTL